MFKFVILFVLAITRLAYSSEEIPSDEGVLVLGKDNFKQAVSDNEFILVKFYAPWCGHCKALAPEYAKAAQHLDIKSSSIKLAKVDATEHQELAEEFGIRGYPTLKFFRKGSAIDYSGGRQSDDIVAWLLKKTGPPAKDLASVEAAKEFVGASNVNVIGFIKDQSTELGKAYLDVAAVIDDIPFAVTSDDAIFGEHEVKDGAIVLFKKFDEGKVVYEGAADPAEIKKFVHNNALPLLVEFNHVTAQKIFGGDIKSHLLLFLNKADAETFEKVSQAAKSIAKPFKNDVLFVTIDAEEEDHQRILEFFAMTKKEVPAARLIKLEEDMIKYKPESNELTADNLKQFVQDFLDNKLKPHLLSQELPEDWDKNDVKVLVASNFDNIALDASKDVLVEFYAPWCGHCKQLAPIYEKVAEHFKDNADVVITKMDATVNELQHTKISNFPTIKLYTKGENQVIEYNGPRTFDGLTKFVESGGQDGTGPEEPVEEVAEDDDATRKDEL